MLWHQVTEMQHEQQREQPIGVAASSGPDNSLSYSNAIRSGLLQRPPTELDACWQVDAHYSKVTAWYELQATLFVIASHRYSAVSSYPDPHGILPTPVMKSSSTAYCRPVF